MLKSFVFRGFVLALVLSLGGCQSAPQPANLPVDDLVSAFRQLEQSLASGQLESAESQLGSLQQRAAGDTRLEQYQRQLAEAHLQQGQQALQAGDLDNATKALSRARSLMPQAPALTTGLDGAIAQAREAELQAAEQRRIAAEQAAARAEAARLQQARQLRLAAERQAAAIQATQLPNVPAEPVAPAKPRARLIDPAAASSVIAMPMLDKQDNERLRSLLDGVAADMLAFRCAVRIEVRQAKDFPWVASLLNARLKRLDPSFSPRMTQVIKPQQVPQLVLSPQR
ncbi:PA5502 family lipoprotein [Pseudomonas sp.]|uniref:PA5502 family lipoprotein n=1 Tax=Pseudomonas sp. TaxID=306 RepID=UPI0027338529|nr:PA5502 family lipoprotein [Pseudomonas sp.]MDP3816467.1 PA5502 family lipoprotein [Pseudomonas sp.]